MARRSAPAETDEPFEERIVEIDETANVVTLSYEPRQVLAAGLAGLIRVLGWSVMGWMRDHEG